MSLNIYNKKTLVHYSQLRYYICIRQLPQLYIHSRMQVFIYLHVYYKLLLSVTLPVGEAEILKRGIYQNI